MTDEADMIKIFERIYGARDRIIIDSAPGRVNIIGEHTDYNDGFVLPTPINSQIWVAASERRDSKYSVYAYDYGEKHSFNLGMQKFSYGARWANYVMGVVDAMEKKGFALRGAELLIKGDVPQSAGLSSSAALEVATIRALKQLFELEINPIELAYIGKSAENEFIGLQSGIMDQFCASIGEHGQALLIDCRDNTHRNINIPKSYALIAVHTGVRRKLDSSAYNERVKQCREGIASLKWVRPEIKSLRDVTLRDLIEVEGKIPDVLIKRCRHVVSENARTLSAVKAMEANDGAKLGELMYLSHASLRNDYGVSCPELDSLVRIAMETGYVLGARLTGAGFGGCTVNLLPEHKIRDFIEEVLPRYRHVTGLEPEVYLV